MQRLTAIPKEGVIPSIPLVIELKHVHDNGKILSDTEIQNAKDELANEITYQINSSRGAKCKVSKIGEKYYATYLNNELGKGGFGRTFVAQELDSGEFVAQKFQHFATDQKLNSIKTEHAHLEKIGQAIATKILNIDKHCLVMKLADGVELNKLINGNGKMAVIQRLQIAMNIIDRVSTLHANNYLHRDIKCKNIMVNPISGRVTLVDFGSAIEWKQQDIYDTKLCGTAVFKAPESLYDHVYSNMSDAFSLAKALGQLFKLTDKNYNITLGFSDVFTKNTCIPCLRTRTILRDLLDQMTAFDPERRLSLQQLKSSLQDIIDVHLDLLGKFNHIGFIDVEELLQDPSKLKTMIVALRNFNEVRFINPNNEISKFELMKLKRLLEEHDVHVGEQVLYCDTEHLEKQISNDEKRNEPNTINFYSLVKTTPNPEPQKNGRVKWMVVDSNKSQEDYQKELSSRHDMSIVDPGHIRFILKHLAQTANYLKNKYGISHINAKKRCDLIKIYMQHLANKDKITYGQLESSLQELQQRMITETWNFRRVFGIKSTAANKVQAIRAEIAQAKNRKSP